MGKLLNHAYSVECVLRERKGTHSCVYLATCVVHIRYKWYAFQGLLINA